MGQTQAVESNWNMDDLAFGTAPNAVTVEEVVDVAQKIPGKLFGAKAIQNDATIHQMQNDLLSFDDTILRLFRRRKHKNSKNKNALPQSSQDEQAYAEGTEYYNNDGQYYSEDQEFYDQDREYYGEDQGYYDRNQQTIPEEDENHAATIYAEDDNASKTIDQNKNLPWRCRYCTAENKATDIDCRQCKQSESRF